ncbi:N-acetylmuramoyl-L-alanine amidase [Desulfurivibrio sp. D14AmB]|uniref:N-acetylmuramoyl-L-alanine amidase n=1 Tax=Desulfurivibrio sp. D14AmB TaxID=3374370 RepID=UPI00376F00FB
MKKLWLPILLLLALIGGSLPLTATGSTPDPIQQFQQIRDYYQRLLNGPEGRTRGNWLRAGQALQRLQRENPTHQVAPQSLYLLGTLYHQLYRRDQNQLDLAESITYFQDLQAKYPRHYLADDALFYLANIFLHDRKEPERAGRALRRIVALYPDGEMAASARRQLRELESSPAAATTAAGGEVLPVRHWSSDSYTRVVIETTEPLSFRSHMLANGDDSRRLYIDLSGARLSPRITRGETPIEDGLLRRIRLAQHDPDTVRVVLDTQTRIDDYKIFSLDNPSRVVIDLLGQPAPPTLRVIQPLSPPKAAPTRVATPGAPPPPLSLAQQLGLGVRRVVIDPGHGGRDPGAISPSGIMEKDVTLRVAKLLATALKQRLGSEVILTRDRDIFLPLEERTAIANSRDADLFISIHVNSAPNRGARGVETYILDMVASDDEAMRVAARENASSARSFSDLQNIVHQLINNAKLQESVHLANMVHETVVESLRQTYGGRINDRGIRRAPFVVLIGARMPALLVEVGFISNPEEEHLLTDEQYLNQLAASIAEGVRQYATNLKTAAR